MSGGGTDGGRSRDRPVGDEVRRASRATSATSGTAVPAYAAALARCSRRSCSCCSSTSLATRSRCFQDAAGDFVTSNVVVARRRTQVSTGLVGSLYLMVFVIWSPSRSASPPPSTWRSTRGTPGSTRFINTNIRNLAGVPAIVYGILGLAIFVEVLRSMTGPGSAELHRRWPDDRGHGAADRHHHDGGGAARRAEEHPRGGVRRRRDAMGGRPQPRAALRGARASSPARCSRWPGRSARRRR